MQIGSDKAAKKISEFVIHLKGIAGPKEIVRTQDIDQKWTQIPEMITLLLKYQLITEA